MVTAMVESAATALARALQRRSVKINASLVFCTRPTALTRKAAAFFSLCGILVRYALVNIQPRRSAAKCSRRDVLGALGEPGTRPAAPSAE